MIGFYWGEEVLTYGYEEKPWFLPGRARGFHAALAERGLLSRLKTLPPLPARDEDLLRFHSAAHLRSVRERCATNEGALDHGPTFARAAVERAATHVVGSVVDALERLSSGELSAAFVPIAGFHHAKREEARNYCLYNDAAVAVSWLKARGVKPIAYLDFDVHTGDGVYDGFASDPDVVIADLHEDGRTLWPHSPEKPGEPPVPGEVGWRGVGAGEGTKLNLPLPAGCDDRRFLEALSDAEDFLASFRPAFYVVVAGVDGMAGDPMAHLSLTPAAIREATVRIAHRARALGDGRLLVLGGGGYAEATLPAGWCAVADALIEVYGS